MCGWLVVGSAARGSGWRRGGVAGRGLQWLGCIKYLCYYLKSQLRKETLTITDFVELFLLESSTHYQYNSKHF